MFCAPWFFPSGVATPVHDVKLVCMDFVGQSFSKGSGDRVG